MTKINYEAIRQQRNKLGMTQSEFWAPLGVTQSAGSRYESGGSVPVPVLRLYFLVYVIGIVDDLNPKNRRHFLTIER